MEKDFEVIGYTCDYPYVNLELKNNNIAEYEMALLICHIEEIKKGMKVKKIYKTTSKGTLIKYEAIESEKEALEYADKIKNMIDKYNNKYRD